MYSDDTTHFRYSLLLREIDNLRCQDDVSTLGLVLIQLDGLDEVNQRFGYLGGDKVLEEFARRVAQIARPEDLTFEISGTSFALLISNPLHEGHAVLGAEKIAQVASDPVVIGSGRAKVKARMGISLLPEPAETAEELLRQCEIALGAARARDESHVVFTSRLTEARGPTGHAWFDVEEALKQGEFELYYQPKVELRSGRVRGAEALIRWQSPRAGTIPPGYFMPVIEHTQGMRSLLWFVLNSALRNASEWVKEIPDFSVSVNVAPGNLEDADLVDIVDGALSIWNFPPRQLLLEMTETALMRDAGSSVVVLNKVRNLGVRVSIDDFGTGYSSLAYLKNLPADELKIDKSFITCMTDDDTDRRIVASVIQLAQAVGLQVVAEGIEDAESMNGLVAMGCELGQGFHFSVPVPSEDFARDWVTPFAHKDTAEG
jgi:diguanylate cyclase (GGDEF)-like protein